MKTTDVSRAALGRIPVYLKYLKSLPESLQTVSSTTIAKELGFGEVQVRKDLSAMCGAGKPRVGYSVADLIGSLEALTSGSRGLTVIIGAGKLGRALLDYDGFDDYGLSVLAAFDAKVSDAEVTQKGKPILPMSSLKDFCREHGISIGVIAVPPEAAQQTCDLLCENGIKAIWCFAPCRLKTHDGTVIQYENMALSLAHLKMQIKQ